MDNKNKEHHISKNPRTAVLLVTTGTTLEESRKLIGNYVSVFKRAFPGTVVRSALTSVFVRQMLASDGEIERSPLGALADLIDEGFTKIIVQPLYIKPGEDLQRLYSIVNTLNEMSGKHASPGIEGIVISDPLLTDKNSYITAADAIVSYLGLPGEKETLVLVSTPDECGADTSLSQLQLVLDDRTGGRVILGSSPGYQDQEWVTKRLEHIGAKRVMLAPFVLIPGNHSVYEVEGDNPKSWRSALEGKGYEVSVSEKLLADSQEISNILVRSLHDTGKRHGFL